MDNTDNPRVTVLDMTPAQLCCGVRLKARNKPKVNSPARCPPIGDAYIVSVEHLADKYHCRTFVWQNEFTLTFNELLTLFCEATLPKGKGQQIMSLFTQDELDANAP